MIKKIFTFLMVVYPIINVYGTQIESIGIGDLLLIIIIPFIIMDLFSRKNENKIKLNIQMGILFLYTLLQLLIIIAFCNQQYSNKIILPTIRLLVYFAIITFFAKTYFDIDLGLKILKKVALFATIFLFIQIIFFYIFSIYIPGTIPGLRASEAIMEYNTIMQTQTTGRLRSIFMEPAHYAMYVSLALGIELIGKEEKDKKAIFILTLGLLMSASSTAIIMVAILYAIYIWKNFKKSSREGIKRLLGLFFIIIIAFPIFMKTFAYEIFYKRTFNDENSSIDGRFGNYDLVLEDVNNINLFFGRGILKISDNYIPTLPRIFYYYGLFGVIFFIAITIKNLITLKGVAWIAWLILLILMFPTEIFFSHYILLYIPFMNKKEMEENYE